MASRSVVVARWGVISSATPGPRRSGPKPDRTTIAESGASRRRAATTSAGGGPRMARSGRTKEGRGRGGGGGGGPPRRGPVARLADDAQPRVCVERVAQQRPHVGGVVADED